MSAPPSTASASVPPHVTGSTSSVALSATEGRRSPAPYGESKIDVVINSINLPDSSSNNLHSAEPSNLRKVHYRRTHKKSHLGCKNCKQRRIKCDEQLPMCGQCARSTKGNKCSFQFLTAEEIATRQAQAEIKMKLSLEATRALQSGSGTPYRMVPLPPSLSLSGQNLLGLHGAIGVPSMMSAPGVSAHHGSLLDQKHHHQLLTTGDVDEATFLSSKMTEKTSTDLEDRLPPISGHNASSMYPTLPSLSQTIPPYLANASPGQIDAMVHSGFETDMIQQAFIDWMSDTLVMSQDASCLFHAFMAFSYGFLAIKSPDRQFRSEAIRHRYFAYNLLNDEVPRVSPETADTLLGASLILSWDVFFEKDSIESYIFLSKGLAAMLEKIQEAQSTTQITMCMKESLFQSIRSIQCPPYNTEFFNDLVNKVRSFEAYIVSSADTSLIHEHATLCEFLERVRDFLRTNTRGGIGSMQFYSPKMLFSFVREWLIRFPCNAMSLDNLPSDFALVLYVYFHCASRAMDAIFPEVRYLFQFGFSGPVDLSSALKATGNAKTSIAVELLTLPARMIGFFKERMSRINRLALSTDVFDSQFQKRVVEKQIISFVTDQISDENYPTLRSESHSNIASSLSKSESTKWTAPSPLSEMSVASLTSQSTAISPSSTSTPVSIDSDSSRQKSTFKEYFADRLDVLQNIQFPALFEKENRRYLS